MWNTKSLWNFGWHQSSKTIYVRNKKQQNKIEAQTTELSVCREKKNCLGGRWAVRTPKAQSFLGLKFYQLQFPNFPPIPYEDESVLLIPLKLVCGKGSRHWSQNPRQVIQNVFAVNVNVLNFSIRVVNLSFKLPNIHFAPKLTAQTKQERWKRDHVHGPLVIRQRPLRKHSKSLFWQSLNIFSSPQKRLP